MQLQRIQRKKSFLLLVRLHQEKTTFSYRLSVQLKAAGLRPHPIGVDNYFVDREKSPKDADGNYNYEDLECIDVAQFIRIWKICYKGRRFHADL